MRVYIAFVMDNASRNVTRVVPLPARARGGDRNRRRDESRRTPFELFFVSSRRPVGVSPRADDSVARECVRDHSFVLTTCVYVNSVSTFARRPSYRRRQMVVCSTPLTEALAVALARTMLSVVAPLSLRALARLALASLPRAPRFLLEVFPRLLTRASRLVSL